MYFKINNNTGMTEQVHTGPADNFTFCMEKWNDNHYSGYGFFQTSGILTSSSEGSAC